MRKPEFSSWSPVLLFDEQREYSPMSPPKIPGDSISSQAIHRLSEPRTRELANPRARQCHSGNSITNRVPFG